MWLGSLECVASSESVWLGVGESVAGSVGVCGWECVAGSVGVCGW